MSIEKITPNEIDSFIADQNGQMEFISALNYIKRLSNGFEDEILSRINAPKKYVKINENTIGELNLNLENIEIQEKSKSQVVEDDTPSENGKFSIYKSNFELDNTDDEIKNFGFKKKNSEEDGNKPKFQLSNDYDGFFDDDETLTDDELNSLTEATAEDEEKDIEIEESNNKNTIEEVGEEKDDDEKSSLISDRIHIYNEKNINNVTTTKRYKESSPIDEFNVYHKSVKFPENTSEIIDSDDTPFGEGKEKIVSTLIDKKQLVSQSDDPLITKPQSKTEEINFNNLKDFGGIKTSERITTASIKRTVINLTGLGTLESAKWQKLSETSDKTLKQFNELPTFTEFKKVQFAMGEVDTEKMITEYQSIVAKFINGGNEILNMSNEELKNELEKYKNSIKNNN